MKYVCKIDTLYNRYSVQDVLQGTFGRYLVQGVVRAKDLLPKRLYKSRGSAIVDNIHLAGAGLVFLNFDRMHTDTISITIKEYEAFVLPKLELNLEEFRDEAKVKDLLGLW